jgi:hypothetical protein
MKIIAITLLGTLISPALAAEKISTSQALEVLRALRGLDTGHSVIVKQNGQDTAVTLFWEFGDGKVREKLAADETILLTVEQITEKARNKIIQELTNGGNTIKPDGPEAPAFMKQWQEVLDSPAPGTQDLVKITTSSLKLDKNEIPIGVISGLSPILEK